MIKIIVSNKLEVYNLPPELDPFLRSACQFEIPIYSDGIPQFIDLYEQLDNYISLPRGFLKTIENYCIKNKLKYDIEYKTAPPIKYNFTINSKINYKTGPYHYQEKTVNKLLKYNLTRLEAPCSSGKTVIACLLIGLLNEGPILFLADQDRLIRQFINTVEKVLDIPKEDIGIIKAKKHIIKPITVGSLRTLGKEGFDLEAIKNTFHVVFFDECHISTALTYRRVILGLAPYRLYGLSATPEHYSSKELNRLMTALLGDIDIKIDKSQIPGRIEPEIVKRETNLSFFYNVEKNSPDWYKHKALNKLFNAISEHKERNDLIIRDCLKLVKIGCKVLITTKRVAHAAYLYTQLSQYDMKVSFPYIYKITKQGEEQAKVNHKQLDIDVEEIERGNIDV